MRNSVILSCDLHVLCCDQGQLIACPIDKFEDFSAIAFLSPVAKGDNFCKGALQPCWLDVATLRFDRSVARGWIKIEQRLSDHGAIRLRTCGAGYDGAHLYVTPSGKVKFARGGESDKSRAFQRITLEEFKALRAFIKTPWLHEKAMHPCRIDMTRSNIWEVILYGKMFDFREIVEAATVYENSEDIFEFVICNEDNIWRFVKFNPLFIYIVNNEKSLSRLFYSIKSIYKNFHNDSNIIIVSTFGREDLGSFIPAELRLSVKFVSISQVDILDKYLSLVPVLNIIDIKEFYPLVIMSPDILLSGKVRSYLMESVVHRGALYNGTVERKQEQPDKGHNFCFREDTDCETSYQFFHDGRIKGSVTFLQNKALLQTALYSYRACLEAGNFPLVERMETDFIEYMLNKYSLYAPSLEEKDGSVFIDSSSWSPEQCDRFLDGSHPA